MSKKQTRALILSPLLLLLTAVGLLAFKASLFGQAQLKEASINNAPRFSQPSVISISEGDVAAIDLTEYFSDPDGDELVYAIIPLPFSNGLTFPWVELNTVDELLTLTPVSGNSGTYSLGIEAFDRSGSSVAGSIDITIEAVDGSVGAGGQAPINPGSPVVDPPSNGGGKPVDIPEPPGLSDLEKEKRRIVKKHHDVADVQRDFQIRNPGHVDLPKSRRLEALSLIEAWQAGDDTRRARRQQAVNAIRKDKSLPIKIRAEVAASADNAAVDQKSHPNHKARIKEYVRVAKALREEFPSWKTGYESLIALARVSDPKEAMELLAIVTQSEHSSERAKHKAAETEARFGLVGESLSSYSRNGDGETLAKLPVGFPAILYTWSSNSPISMEKAVRLSRKLDKKVAFLGVCLGGHDFESSAKLAEEAGLPGVQLFDDESASLASNLSLDTPAMGYIIDRRGRIAAVSLDPEIMIELGIADFLKQ